MRKHCFTAIHTLNCSTEVSRRAQLTGEQSDWVVMGKLEKREIQACSSSTREIEGRGFKTYSKLKGKSQQYSKLKASLGYKLKAELGGGREGERQRQRIQRPLKMGTCVLKE